MGDRVNKVSIGKFDQVVALTQHMINQGLQSQWDWASSEEFNDPVNVVLRRSGYQGFYKTNFGAPRVIIRSAVGDRSSCTFRMLIRTAKMKVFYSSDDTDESVTSYNLQNFALACPVNMALAGLDKDDPDYQRIRKLMNKPGDYTIRQLLVDFASAQTRVLNVKDCDFGIWTDDDWVLRNMDVPSPRPGASPTKDYWRPAGWEKGKKRDLGLSVTKNLQGLFQQSLDSVMVKGAAGQLGFTAEAADTSSTGHEPTFVPTDVRFQTYPYQDENGPVQPSLDGKGRLNYLLYLEMTDGRGPPTGSDEFLEAKGNWTNGTDPDKDGNAEFGTYVLSRANFLERWLVPKLKKLNRMMSATYEGCMVDFGDNLFSWWATFRFPVVVGNGCKGFDVADPDDDGYAMEYKTEPPKDVKDMAIGSWKTLEDGALCWYYEKTPHNWDESGKSYACTVHRIAKSYCCSRLSVVPGSNKITLEGFTRLHFGFEVYQPIDPNVYELNTVEVTWGMDFIMTEVSDGGLAIQIEEKAAEYSWKALATGWKDAATGNPSDIKGRVNLKFDDAAQNLGNLVHEMKNALEGNEKFYFPSRGRFFFKDALFSHNGDLVVKCEYNGAETGPANPDADAHRDLSGVPSFISVTNVVFGSQFQGDKKKDDQK